MKPLTANRAAASFKDETQPETISYRGMSFAVDKRVFFPGTDSSCGTHFFTDQLVGMDDLPDSMIEVGCGMGLTGLALLKLQKLERLVSTDISPHAVRCARENKRRLDVTADIFVSDVFDAVKPRAVGSTYWNSPWSFLPANKKNVTRFNPCLYDPGYKLLERYVRDSRNFLGERGRCFLGSGRSANIPALWTICKRYGCEPAVMADNYRGKTQTLVLYELVRPTGKTLVQMPGEGVPTGVK